MGILTQGTHCSPLLPSCELLYEASGLSLYHIQHFQLATGFDLSSIPGGSCY